MTKYKYSRKRIVKKLSYYMNVKFPYKLIDDLLATLSPEEESQKIMMEQVPKSSKEKECIDRDCTCNCHTPTPSTNIKEIELPKKLITVDNCAGLTQFTFEQEFKDWIKQVTNSLNTIIKK